MIAPDSASFPVLAAAEAAGAPYGLALAYAEAFQADSGWREQVAFSALVDGAGAAAAEACARAIITASLDGRLAGRGAKGAAVEGQRRTDAPPSDAARLSPPSGGRS